MMGSRIPTWASKAGKWYPNEMHFIRTFAFLRNQTWTCSNLRWQDKASQGVLRFAHFFRCFLSRWIFDFCINFLCWPWPRTRRNSGPGRERQVVAMTSKMPIEILMDSLMTSPFFWTWKKLAREANIYYKTSIISISMWSYEFHIMYIHYVILIHFMYIIIVCIIYRSSSISIFTYLR